MRNLFFLIAVLLLSSCSRDNSCNCNSQRWERTGVYDVDTQNLISASEWEKKGSEEADSSTNCNDNGRVKRNGSENAHMIPSTNTYSRIDYEYRLNCK